MENTPKRVSWLLYFAAGIKHKFKFAEVDLKSYIWHHLKILRFDPGHNQELLSKYNSFFKIQSF